MSGHDGRVVLLGSRPESDAFRGEVDGLRGGGSVAWITAGRQEWEEEDQALRDAVAGLEGEAGGGGNLRLYARAEEIWRRDPELAEAHRDHQRRMRLLRRAYNVRLQRLMEGWTRTTDLDGDPSVLDPERSAALDDVRRLDAHHAHRIDEARREFESRVHLDDREAVREGRDEVAAQLRGVGVVLVAGGHVPLLLNRLRLFDIGGQVGERSLLAWGGGTMALSRRVVLFHDSPPWGPGHPEVGEVGLDRIPGVVALPDAGRRLRLDDGGRVHRMARRFAPDVCLLLDHGARAEWDGFRWAGVHGRRLVEGGGVEDWRGAA